MRLRNRLDVHCTFFVVFTKTEMPVIIGGLRLLSHLFGK